MTGIGGAVALKKFCLVGDIVLRFVGDTFARLVHDTTAWQGFFHNGETRLGLSWSTESSTPPGLIHLLCGSPQGHGSAMGVTGVGFTGSAPILVGGFGQIVFAHLL